MYLYAKNSRTDFKKRQEGNNHRNIIERPCIEILDLKPQLIIYIILYNIHLYHKL